MSNLHQARTALRKEVRKRRNNLSHEHQSHAELLLIERLSHFLIESQANSIAIYLANDAELRTNAIINWCWVNNIEVYLPIIHPFSKHHLLFQAYSANTQMVSNRYGIAEPKLDVQTIITPNNLDILFTPLVAFDKAGNRMGMGGGFYDRTLSQLKGGNTQVIGLAHDCQQVENIPAEPWDMPLSKIITPTQVIYCDR